ncbi:MAG: glycosyltransferase family 2 protein, partial [Anaerolineales bacterium]
MSVIFPMMTEKVVEVSIVIPCLNEENSIGVVVEKAWRALGEMGVQGEVVVADNGSTDRSAEIARSLGARVVDVPVKGYGSALIGGIESAQGQYIVIGDADNSYDFLESPLLLAKLREGYDLVIGSRLRGKILPGAMRLSSRLGNPLVTGILNLLFGSHLSDSQSGMRAFTREAWRRLRLLSSGMEFASEMLIQAQRAGLRIGEVPITYYPDQRGRPPHLRPLRDGWRHLKLMLTYSPTVLFLIPGGLMMLFGFLLMSIQLLAPMDQPLWLGPVRLDFHWAILGSLLTLSGYTLIQAHFLAKIYSVTHRFQEQDRVLEVGFRVLT